MSLTQVQCIINDGARIVDIGAMTLEARDWLRAQVAEGRVEKYSAYVAGHCKIRTCYRLRNTLDATLAAIEAQTVAA